MGTDLATIEPRTVTLSTDQLQYIAGTEFVPPGLRGNLPAILACVATGRAIGIPDMTALRSIHIIDGKPTYSAELMVMLARGRGHSIVGELGEGTATVTGTRIDNGDEMTVEWTLGMADRAGLLGKQNWRKYPEAMLWARAVSQLCRMLFADCFAGATYTPEELDGAPLFEDLEPGPKAASPVSDAPRGEHPSGSEKSPTAAQLKKLNLMVGQLRDQLRLKTEDVYLVLDKPQIVGEDRVLHWSPLRDTLTRAEAHQLIDLLEAYEKSRETVPPWPPVLVQAILAQVDPDKREGARAAIEANREKHAVAPDRHVEWLKGQLAKFGELAGA
jgi:hypothetical protein